MVTEADPERQLGIDDPLEDRSQVPAVEHHHHALRRNLLPVRIATLGNNVAEDVTRLLAHAQIGDHETPVDDVRAHEVIGEPAQPLDRPDVTGVGQRLRIGRMARKRDVSFIDEQRIE